MHPHPSIFHRVDNTKKKKKLGTNWQNDEI
jgi:hypothetical protein